MMPSSKKTDLDTALDKCEDLVAGALISPRIMKFEEREIAVFTKVRHILAISLLSEDQASQATALVNQVLKLNREGKVELTEAQTVILRSVLNKVDEQRRQIEELNDR